MRFNAPKTWVWWLSLIVVVVGVVCRFAFRTWGPVYDWIIIGIGWLLLFLGTTIKGF